MRHPASRPSMRHSTCLILAIVAVSHIASSDGRKPFWGNAKPKDCRCGVVQRSTASGDYIIHGKETEVNEYPWQVKLYVCGRLIGNTKCWSCGGSLIGDQWVLTAAHCMPQGPGTLEVYLASHSRAGYDGIRMVPEFIIPHPNYARGYRELFYDFALIKLQDRVNFNMHQNIRPICLPKPGDDSYEGETAIATGWGVTETGDGSWNLKEVKLKVISNRQCRKDKPRTMITKEMICAGVKNGMKDTGKGDSGGPLIVKRNGESYELIGVTSFGLELPGVYARVSNQMGWITKMTGGSLRSCPRQ